MYTSYSRDLVVLREADLPLEVVILLVAGMAFLIAGILLFPVSSGVLPYYENGLYGLFLVIFALQTITLGKTPFGDARRSTRLFATGVVIAALGIVTCFIPTFNQIPRVLLFLSFGPGGLLLLLQMCFAKDKLPLWIRCGGVFRHLIVGCSLVYLFSMLVAVLLWNRDLLSTPMTAAVILIYGIVVIYLAVALRAIYRLYPAAERPRESDTGLSVDHSMILLMAVFMLLLGALLIPVSLGLLPFSASAQLGLLMVVFAVQLLACGSTPLGPFPRTWLMMAFGLLFAALGIVSCLIPDILVAVLTVLVGVLNILGGIITLTKIGVPLLRRSDEPRDAIPLVLVKLFTAQLVMNLLTILFGVAMLIPHLIPGLVIGVILAVNGCVLLYLLHILIVSDSMKRSTTDAV